jgi:DNA (cytosine-5)-methyltransferase 1
MQNRVLITAKAEPKKSDGSLARVERHEIHEGRLLKRVLRRDGTWTDTDFGEAPKRGLTPARLHAIADLGYLQSKQFPDSPAGDDDVTVADLFGGLGALTLGVFEAARVIGRPAELTLAADLDPAPLQVLRKTFDVDELIARMVDLGQVLKVTAGKPTQAEADLIGKNPKLLDVLVAGPPCQGHSSLNNHTRHDDPRNDLYGRVARFAELRRPRLCIIENVDSVVNDQRENASKAAERLEGLGYNVDEGKVPLHDLGVPQRRRRHILVATDRGERILDVNSVIAAYSVEDPGSRNLKWAIGDLERLDSPQGLDAPGTPSKENKKRMRWLHEKPYRYDLPNLQRPDCHKNPRMDEQGIEREHSYRSMYGKLDWSKPAQTITSGYGSMGQGRYVHPSKQRTLTPHEAARLQFIPDFVRFDAVNGRGKWARMIGNVAPMKLSYVFAVEFLR